MNRPVQTMPPVGNPNQLMRTATTSRIAGSLQGPEQVGQPPGYLGPPVQQQPAWARPQTIGYEQLMRSAGMPIQSPGARPQTIGYEQLMRSAGMPIRGQWQGQSDPSAMFRYMQNQQGQR